MSEDSNILSPGINSGDVWKMQNSPRALIADKFYKTATGIKNKAGAFVGFALNDKELDQILNSRQTRRKDLARSFFNRYSRQTGSKNVGRFLIVGTELDLFLDILAGLRVQEGYAAISQIVTPGSIVKPDELNKKEEGRRW